MRKRVVCHLSSPRSDRNVGLLTEAARQDMLPQTDAFLGTSNRGLSGSHAFRRLLMVCLISQLCLALALVLCRGQKPLVTSVRDRKGQIGIRELRSNS